MAAVTGPILLAALGAGLQGLGGMSQAKATKYQADRQARESKRKTLAELLNAALGREFEGGETMRSRGADLATSRANALQNVASQYVQAFRR